jgi:nitrogen fixation protein NifQ
VMNAEDAYQRLMGASASSHYSAFDLHVFAAILSLALADAPAGDSTVLEGIGLEKPALMDLIAELFPGVRAEIEKEIGDFPVPIDDEEQSIRGILSMYSTGASYLVKPLGAMIARRCKWPHHLWQDLGLTNRSELSMLMRRHFARLADKNRQDMKWKKFLYRMVCGSEGFVLCTAPICSECDDFKNCFGAEDGESRLAHARNSSHMVA